MEIEVDLAKAKAAGIKPGEVRRAAATLLSGLRVGNLFEDQKVFDVMVWSTPESRNSLSSVAGPAHRRSERGPCAPRRHRRRPGALDLAEHRARGHLPLRGRDRQRQRPQRGQRQPRRQGPAQPGGVPAGVPRRAARSLLEAAGRPASPPGLRHRRGHRHLPAAAGRLRQLAPGHHRASSSSRWRWPVARWPLGSTAARDVGHRRRAAGACWPSRCATSCCCSVAIDGCGRTSGSRSGWTSATRGARDAMVAGRHDRGHGGRRPAAGHRLRRHRRPGDHRADGLGHRGRARSPRPW